MTDLIKQLEETEAKAERIRAAIRAGPCQEYGCDMQSIGGMNASCQQGDDCACSVPVLECIKCKRCDYGDNPEATEIRRKCKEEQDG